MKLKETRYKSTFTELPLIGKIPRYIKGNVLKTKLGDVDLRKQSCNFFTKLNWYEGRTFIIETVKVKKEIFQSFGEGLKIKPGKILKVKEIDFRFSLGAGCWQYNIEVEMRKGCFATFSADHFIPVKYQILKEFN